MGCLVTIVGIILLWQPDKDMQLIGVLLIGMGLIGDSIESLLERRSDR